MLVLKRSHYRLKRLQSILLKVMMWVYLSLVNNAEKKWVVDSIPWQQLDKGAKNSWKLCLNLCSLKWVKPKRSHVISLIVLELWQLYTELAAGLINWRIFFLNVTKLAELRWLGFNLFHSEIAERKKRSIDS